MTLYHLKTVQTGSGPTQPPAEWVLGILSPGVKRPERESDHSHLSRADVKNARSYTCTPQYVFMAWYLVKHRDNFTFALLIINVDYTASNDTGL
jgi:hypothetical protein